MPEMVDLQLLPLLVAGMAGASMAVAAALNTVMSASLGEYGAAFVVQVVSAALLGAIVLFSRSSVTLEKIMQVPWWAFLGAPLHALITWGVLTSTRRTSVGAATTAILALQISTAIFLDVVGLTGKKVPLDWKRASGGALFILGAYLLLRNSSK